MERYNFTHDGDGYDGCMDPLPVCGTEFYVASEVQLRIRHVAQWLKNGCSVTHAVEELEAMIAESKHD